VACLLTAQLGLAGLSAQARLRRRLLLEGGDDLTRRRPGLAQQSAASARSRSRILGARRRRLLAPSHDWCALLAAVVYWRRKPYARLLGPNEPRAVCQSHPCPS
jgi:hypothetical protein